MENYGEKINWEKYKKPIVIEKAMFNTVPKTYLYEKELNIVKDILERFDNENGSKNEAISRNITIAGERGSGKTSFLKSLKNILSDDYYVFDIVGSEILSSNMTIIDVFLSKLDVLINIIYKDNQENCIKLSELKGLLKKAMAAIGAEKQEKEYFKNGQPENAMLQALSDRLRLEGIFAEILDCLKGILEFQGKTIKDFILIIDDLDLVKNSLVSQFLTEIQRYLDKKLIIIFAYRERQLENSLFEDRFNDNKNLIGKNIIESDEIYSQIEQFLVKLVPYGNRINLFKQDDVLNLKINGVLASLEPSEKKWYELDNNLHITLRDKSSSDYNEGLTVEEWFYEYIHRHTDLYIKPIDTREDNHQFLPRSLRELIQCFEVFDRMILPTRDDGITIFLDRILSNLKILEQYKNFRVESYFSSDRKKIDYFELWEASKSFRKNKLTYDFVFHNYDESFIQQDLDYPLNLSKREDYNLTLGDILTLIEHYKYSNANKCRTNEYYFFYIIKLNYSIYLSKLFIESTLDYKINGEYNDSKIESYLQTINTKFMPSEFNYLSNNVNWDKEDYVLKYAPIYDFVIVIDDKKEKIEEFVRQFYYSDVSVEGEVRNHIDKSYFNSQYRFRNLYNYKEITPTKGQKYMFDFFVACNKERYIKTVIEDFEDGENKPFIFKNIFQVDLFIRKNYFRSKESAFEYALERVNDVIGGNKGRKEGDLDFQSLKTILYSSSTNQSNYDEIFKDFGVLYKVNEMSNIYNIMKSENMRLSSRSNRRRNIPLDNKLNLPIAREEIGRVLSSPIRGRSYEDLIEEVLNIFDNYYLDVRDKNMLDNIIRQFKLHEITSETVMKLHRLYRRVIDKQTITQSLETAIVEIESILARPIIKQSYEGIIEVLENIFNEYNLDADDRMELNNVINQISIKEITRKTIWQIDHLLKRVRNREEKGEEGEK